MGKADERVMRKLLTSLPADATDEQRIEVLLTEFSLTEQGRHHGTYARAQIHYEQGQEPCGPCRTAFREYQQGWRERRRQAAYKKQEPQ